MAYVLVACRALVGLVFLAALVGKLRNRSQFAAFVESTKRLAPAWLSRRVPVRLLAAATVAAEVSVVVLLALPAGVPWGFLLTAGVALVFGVAIGAALRRGERGSCNCFGASKRPLGAGQLVRNILLGAVAVVGLAAWLAGTGPLDPAGAAVALAVGVVGAVLLVTADDIVDLFRPVTIAR